MHPLPQGERGSETAATPSPTAHATTAYRLPQVTAAAAVRGGLLSREEACARQTRMSRPTPRHHAIACAPNETLPYRVKAGATIAPQSVICSPRMKALLRIILAGLTGLALAAPAAAHPHVWVTMKSELVYASDGRVTGIRHHWAFDEMFSAFATQGIQSRVKGQFTREDLAPLAKINVDSIKEYKYFTYATADGKKVPFADPLPGYWLEYKNPILMLNFTLPFKHPVKSKRLKVEIYDPTFFIDFAFMKTSPVELVGAPKRCSLKVVLPPAFTTMQSQTLGEQFFNALTAAQNWGSQFANVILVNCP